MDANALGSARQAPACEDQHRWPRRAAPRVRWRLFRWMLRFTASKVRRKPPSAELANELTDILSDIGGVGVKVGQLLSLRPDVFSVEFCNVLADLQFQFVGFPTYRRAGVHRKRNGAAD